MTIRVLMVCMGNICRSPTAEAVLRHYVRANGLGDQVEIDSAGTHGYHVGEAPDARSQQHARRRGYDLSRQRARQLTKQDFDAFDLVLVMDSANEVAARRIATPAQQQRMKRLTDYCQRFDEPEVPDPYYGGDSGFEHVLDLIEDACQNLLHTIAKKNPR